MKTYPPWVLKHKQKGVEIRKIGANYYCYKIRSVWDPEKKRPKKVTEKFLGKITPEGVVKPKYERVLESIREISVKEFGASHFILSTSSWIIEPLKECYPEEWKEIIVFAIMRFFHSTPMKNVFNHYISSHLSDVFSEAKVSAKSLSNLLRSVGRKRNKTVEFMKNFVLGSQFAVVDLTHVFSLSENVISATLGYNTEGEYVPQINFVLVFSLDKRYPSFFRLVPGSIRDVSIIPLTLQEAGISKALLIGDKGLASMTNINFFEEKRLEYILPLKRNNALIDYRPIKSGDKRDLDGYFVFEKRVIWYYEKKLGEHRRVLVFLDEKLKVEEEKDFISHIEKESGQLSLEDFYQKQFSFGTIAVITNSGFAAKKVYELLKSRIEIEVFFDTFKNVLHADRTYMRDDIQLEGWMFVNFVSLLLYYRVYEILVNKDLLKQLSPRDVILHLSRIYKLRIGDRWVVSEVPKTSRLLVEKLGLDLHIT